jgi:hypothetical protein
MIAALVPSWARALAIGAIAVALLAFGYVHGLRKASQDHLDYVAEQARQSTRIAQAQTKVVIQTEVKYRDRIRAVYLNGETIEKEVPVYVTQADSDRCTVNAGFVRVHDSAWTGEPAGAAAESDREPAGISLAEVSQADAFNATACLAWRDQALGWREFYEGLRRAQGPE